MIYRFLSKIKPINWLLIYLLIIPTYAFIYSQFFKFEFYHSNSKLEIEYLNETKPFIENKIKDALIQSIAKNIDLDSSFIWHLNHDNQHINIKKLTVNSLNNSDKPKNIYFIIRLDLLDDTVKQDFTYLNKGVKGLILPFQMNLYYNIFNLNKDNSSVSVSVPKYLIYEKDKTQIKDSIVLKIQETLSHIPIYFSQQDEEIITAWKLSYDGFPGMSNGSFMRMFYFSAITITTIGFGDIVPISESARLLVASEAIIGTIIIGLFLNSLATSISENLLNKK